MDWKHLFLDFSGRINRKPFWIGMVILFLVNLVVSQVLGGLLLQLVVWVVFIYPSIAVSVKRCHDRGKSGWWCLLYVIPLVGLVWAIVDLGILEGDEGDNNYGSNPLAGGAAA